MGTKTRIFALSFALLGTATATRADVVQRIKFVQAPTVIVWDGDAGPVSGQSIDLAKTVSLPIPVYVQTGILEPVTASLGDEVGPERKTFRIASNAPFAIRAHAELVAGAPDVPFQLRVGAIGENAQTPGPTQSAPGLQVSDLATSPIVYQSTRRTAARRGAVESQTVEFVAEWFGEDAVDVSFTIFALETSQR